MNLLKSTYIAYVAILHLIGTAAQDDSPSPPTLEGMNFKITLIENLDYLVKVDKDGDGAPADNEISGYMVDMIKAVAAKAGFTYELVMPSGKGTSCSPPLADDANLYAAAYRPQFNCGQEDVFAGESDMYWSLYYVTPFRQLRNQFTLPYKPPSDGALTMFGVGSGVKDFDDLIEQQKEGSQKPVCLGENTAYSQYLKDSFPDMQSIEIPNTDDGALQGIKDGSCDIIVNAYPYALDFIAKRYETDQCEVNGKAFGIVGEPLGFGLSQFAIGVRNGLPAEVTNAISYWLNFLITCAPGANEGDCETESGLSLFETYESYGRHNPNLCKLGPQDPTDDPEGTTPSPLPKATPAPVPAAPEESSGDGRMLGAVAAGVLGAIFGRLV